MFSVLAKEAIATMTDPETVTAQLLELRQYYGKYTVEGRTFHIGEWGIDVERGTSECPSEQDRAVYSVPYSRHW